MSVEVLILLAVNLGLKLKSFRAPLDFDTANHLYHVLLRKRKVPFLRSYGFGLKILLLHLYTCGKTWVERAPYRFRLLNIISSSLVIILWSACTPGFDLDTLPVFLLGVLLLNSLWVNSLTSAAEFHSVVLVMALCVLPSTGFIVVTWVVQLVILGILIGGFKIINLLYLIPVLAMHTGFIQERWWWYAAGTALLGIYVARGFKHKMTATKRYAKTRRWINPKSRNFILLNPHFCLGVALLGLGNILYTPWQWAVLQVTLWIIFLIQRYYTSYFFYPLVATGAFIAFKTGWILAFPPLLGWILCLAVFLGHTLPHILLLSPRDTVIRYRRWICRDNWRSYLEARKRQVVWLRENIEPGKPVYLWGSEVSLLLLAGLHHIPGTFYSHNHLLYWSGVDDPYQYAVDQIRKQKPRYIIEAAVISSMVFPRDEFNDCYSEMVSMQNMTVYVRK